MSAVVMSGLQDQLTKGEVCVGSDRQGVDEEMGIGTGIRRLSFERTPVDLARTTLSQVIEALAVVEFITPDMNRTAEIRNLLNGERAKLNAVIAEYDRRAVAQLSDRRN